MKEDNNEMKDLVGLDKSQNMIIRYILILIGSIAVLLGVLGVFLPILPTTPFLLLAAACYAKSSEIFYNWLLNNRWFGEYIRNYRENKGITLKVKISALSFLWITILITSIFYIPIFYAKILLIIIASAVTIHILKIRTLRVVKIGDEDIE